jgi:hypothetical protein
LTATVSDRALSNGLGFILLVAAGAWVIYAVLRSLRRRRPDLDIGLPVLMGGAGRMFVLAFVGFTGAGSGLRGGDEAGFLAHAAVIAHTPFGTADWFASATSHLHEFVMAVQIKLFNASVDSMRVTQVVITMMGLLWLCAAVYDVAGPRAARLAAWLMMLEPANLFFSSILHKEPLMYFGTGLVALGCVRMWRNMDAWGLGLMTVGCYVAVTTRAYAGYFLLAGAVFSSLHAALAQLGGRRARAVPLLIAITAGIALATGPLQRVSDKQLLRLQKSQAATAVASQRGNLAFETLDYSTPLDVVKNLPRRMYDVTLKPYIWQVSNTSQQLGVLGTLGALATFFVLFRLLLVRWRRGALRRVLPLLYPAAFLYAAYAISAGNAGTSFRYRTTVLVVLMGAAAILWTDQRQEQEQAAGEVPPPDGSAGDRARALLDSARRGLKVPSSA